LISRAGLDLWGIMVMDISDQGTLKILFMQYANLGTCHTSTNITQIFR
jgi:hypothetical protein